MGNKLTEVRPNIFLLSFDSSYDLAMHFCRLQEFYENPEFKGKRFTMFEFMKWYADEHGDGCFSYPADWSGFNVPSTVALKLYGTGNLSKIPDRNEYDQKMWEVITYINQVIGRKNFYLLGSAEGDLETLKHELAHGFWATDQNYRQVMEELVNQLDDRDRFYLSEWLTSNMYDLSVVPDEIQAYLATGLDDVFKQEMKRRRVKHRKIAKPFIEVFNQFYER